MLRRLPRPNPPKFEPRSIEDVFALYLSRELQDELRVRWYANLARKHSLALLLNALRRARQAAPGDEVPPEQFVAAVRAMMDEEEVIT